jgi:hypothetical protein
MAKNAGLAAFFADTVLHVVFFYPADGVKYSQEQIKRVAQSPENPEQQCQNKVHIKAHAKIPPPNSGAGLAARALFI